MDRRTLIAYLESMDSGLEQITMLYIYGSAALMLLGEEGRTSLDIDVAAPYSRADLAVLRKATERAGLAFNPDEAWEGDHIEWVSALRLCLPPPRLGQETLLWRGRNLQVVTGPVADLVASKLIRYDEIDQADIRYLHAQSPIRMQPVRDAVSRLPAPFDHDALVIQNLKNLETDLAIWGERHDPA